MDIFVSTFNKSPINCLTFSVTPPPNSIVEIGIPANV